MSIVKLRQTSSGERQSDQIFVAKPSQAVRLVTRNLMASPNFKIYRKASSRLYAVICFKKDHDAHVQRRASTTRVPHVPRKIFPTHSSASATHHSSVISRALLRQQPAAKEDDSASN
ncbi:hypothetical protein B0H14DRAFT_3852300 [Mycena olivaceomarginata]|nr:hypothetical protein B0H14DRAFT_3852300 [Mycena olivaceomarginata]